MTEAIYLEVSEKTEAAKCKQRRFSVSGMLKFLGVSRSGYRSWLNRVTSNTQKRKETNHTLINVVQIPVFCFHEQAGKRCLFQYLKEDGNLAAGDGVLIDDRTARGSFIAVLAVEGNICIKFQSIQQILRIHLQEMAARCNEQPYPRFLCPVKGMSGIIRNPLLIKSPQCAVYVKKYRLNHDLSFLPAPFFLKIRPPVTKAVTIIAVWKHLRKYRY